MDEVIYILGVLLLGTGCAMYLFGWLAGMATALGNKRYLFGVAILILHPLALIYCLANWDKASYPGKLLLYSLPCVIVGLIVMYYSGMLFPGYPTHP
jgi:FtsH-binding integral membrane protein